MTLRDFIESLYPELPIVELLNGLIQFPASNVDENEVVNVAVPEFIKNMRDLVSATPARVQANYIIWRNIQPLIKLLNGAANQLKQEFKKTITGQKSEVPRWEKCVKAVAGEDTDEQIHQGGLSNAVGSMYARAFFPLEAKQKADEIVENVLMEFKNDLSTLTWMDEVTKGKALEKANKMSIHVAYAEEILDETLVDNFYEGLELSSDSFLKNYLQVEKFKSLYFSKLLRKKLDKDDWRPHGGAHIINAYYSPEKNSMSYPAGILSGAFFDADRPAYLNYGAIGIVAGHEVTHGFDDQGSQYDANGKGGYYEHTNHESFIFRQCC